MAVRLGAWPSSPFLQAAGMRSWWGTGSAPAPTPHLQAPQQSPRRGPGDSGVPAGFLPRAEELWPLKARAPQAPSGASSGTSCRVPIPNPGDRRDSCCPPHRGEGRAPGVEGDSRQVDPPQRPSTGSGGISQRLPHERGTSGRRPGRALICSVLRAPSADAVHVPASPRSGPRGTGHPHLTGLSLFPEQTGGAPPRGRLGKGSTFRGAGAHVAGRLTRLCCSIPDAEGPAVPETMSPDDPGAAEMTQEQLLGTSHRGAPSGEDPAVPRRTLSDQVSDRARAGTDVQRGKVRRGRRRLGTCGAGTPAGLSPGLSCAAARVCSGRQAALRRPGPWADSPGDGDGDGDGRERQGLPAAHLSRVAARLRARLRVRAADRTPSVLRPSSGLAGPPPPRRPHPVKDRSKTHPTPAPALSPL